MTLKTFKDRQEKYGRYLADIYLTEDVSEVPSIFRQVTVCINDELVVKGQAVYKDY